MIPLMQPSPLGLGDAADALASIEARGILSNFGPVNTRFENNLRDRMFGGNGACLTVCNATLGLMLAIRQAADDMPGRRFALMPSFTFAAAAQAALWCGLTPLFCDIDARTWAADPDAETELLQRYAGDIAVVVPYATFGYDIDFARYEAMKARYGVPVVVDAAASLGTASRGGQNSGAGFSGAVVFSMHATKSFSTGEGGVIYSANAGLIARLRTMSNYGFGSPRTATMPGLNAKMSEVAALLAQRRLDRYDAVVRKRDRLMRKYRAALPHLTFQGDAGRLQAHQFAPALLSRAAAPLRQQVQNRVQARGVGMATYFSPHVAEHPYFAGNSVSGSLDVTRDVASRIISLPLYDAMTSADVLTVAACLSGEMRALDDETAVCDAAGSSPDPAPSRPDIAASSVRQPPAAETHFLRHAG